MTVAVDQEQLVEEESQLKKDIVPSNYGCEILLEKTTIECADDKSFPTDARLIWYKVGDTVHMDLTRCAKVVRLFDMYYDMYGKDSIQKIDFGFGSVNPKMWGYKPKEEKKKRK